MTKLLRNADLLVLFVALPVFLVASISLWAWVAVAVAWIAQRVVNNVLVRRAQKDGADVGREMNFVAVGVVSRAWLPGIAALLVGLLTEREVGLAAVILAIAVFTIHFITSLALRASSASAPSRTTVQYPTEGQS
ncbi:MAG: hypothetical protein ITG02_00115 [Patulibacter sp.]|nr:hypothetical protein [Patulibacter sp.]